MERKDFLRQSAADLLYFIIAASICPKNGRVATNYYYPKITPTRTGAADSRAGGVPDVNLLVLGLAPPIWRQRLKMIRNGSRGTTPDAGYFFNVGKRKRGEAQ